MSDDPADFSRKAVEGRLAAQQQLEREQAPALKFLADREAEALQREVEAVEKRIAAEETP